jgi:hypothetical protein
VNARVAVLCLTVATSACVHRPSFMQPEPARRWPGVYLTAQVAADQGRYDDADRVLAAFARDYPGSAESQESGYWRAIYKLDPANKTANTRDALAGLDAYLAASRAGTHRGEATTIRRLAQQLVSLDRALSSKPAETHDKARDEEVQKLKDELQATKDELELIKRRLATPKP